MLSGLKRIISKYSNNYTIVDRTEGSYINGRWVEGTATETELEGAVVPLSRNDLKIAEKGTYTEDDRKLYSIYNHDIGQIVIHKSKEYKIHKKPDYSDWTSIDLNLTYLTLSEALEESETEGLSNDEQTIGGGFYDQYSENLGIRIYVLKREGVAND